MATASSSGDRSGESAAVFAFDEIGPSPLTHIKSSKIHYDVFINHRGPDVKRSLASIIHQNLTSLGVTVFLDQKSLQLGDFISTELEDVMRSASIHIAIFSRNYAQSTWCLRELSFMLKTGNKIIPVFYDVQPSDLRWVAEEKGVYVEAFAQHEKKGREKTETLKEWKAALKEVSNFKGYEFKTNDDEGLLLKTVVDCVLREMKMKRAFLNVALHPVGLDLALGRFEETLLQSFESKQAVQFVGIVGLGGSGKTTLAKELYNRKCSSMERSSFLFNVRDTPDSNGLCKLQKKLLKDILGHRNFSFDHISQGMTVLASHLRSLRILIVLDDVDRMEQLDALLPGKESFGHGSLIIVTARDSDVLRSWSISCIFKMDLLIPEHAKQLFCWHAFSQSESPPDFEDLVKMFVGASYGLPLSLKILGRMVSGRCREYWESKLDKVLKTLPKEIEKVLKASYDSLEEKEQQMFLDTACFFIGERKSLAIEVWDGAGWSGLQGLETLLDKCLIEIDQHERIGMHHHLSDLGKNIANESSPYRIWVAKQISNVRKHCEVTNQVRGIMAAKTQFDGISSYQVFPIYSDRFLPPFEECMELMKNSNRGYKRLRYSLLLQVLVVAHDHFTSKFAELSIDLVWLRWFDFKLEYLPSWMSLRNLRVLDIYGALSLEELWTDNVRDPPLQLRELTVAANGGNSFDRFPRSILHLHCLKKMALISRYGDEFGFTSLPEEFCELEHLEHLELRYCRLLSSLPTGFGDLKNLRHLDLSSCHCLRKLPISFKDLINLKFLNFSDCRRLRVTSDIFENMGKLGKLFFSGCRKLKELPYHITDLESLKELHLVDTRLREVPTGLYRLSKLETLKIGSPHLTTLPASLYCLPSLTHLFIRDCISLHSLPDCIESSIESKRGLARLQHFCIESTNVSRLPLLSLCKLNNLETLKISDCPISELCLTPGSLVKLKVINLRETPVTSISISEECCPGLEAFQLEKNDDLEEIDTLPSSVKLIELTDCKSLKKIRCLPALTKIRSAVVSGCPKYSDEPEQCAPCGQLAHIFGTIN